MESLASIIKQSIEHIDTRNLIYKSPFEDRFTNELVRKLNSKSGYFCIEQYPIKLGDKRRDSKIDIVGFNKNLNHEELISFEMEYTNKNIAWGLEAKLFSPYFRLKSTDKYIEWTLGGPRNDFKKLYEDFDHFVILLIQDDIDSYEGIEEDDFKVLNSTYNIFKLINSNFEIAKKQLKRVSEEDRVSTCFKRAQLDFDYLATLNNLIYSSEQGYINKKLIHKGKYCPLKIHFMINEFSKIKE